MRKIVVFAIVASFALGLSSNLVDSVKSKYLGMDHKIGQIIHQVTGKTAAIVAQGARHAKENPAMSAMTLFALWMGWRKIKAYKSSSNVPLADLADKRRGVLAEKYLQKGLRALRAACKKGHTEAKMDVPDGIYARFATAVAVNGEANIIAKTLRSDYRSPMWTVTLRVR